MVTYYANCAKNRKYRVLIDKGQMGRQLPINCYRNYTPLLNASTNKSPLIITD